MLSLLKAPFFFKRGIFLFSIGPFSFPRSFFPLGLGIFYYGRSPPPFRAYGTPLHQAFLYGVLGASCCMRPDAFFYGTSDFLSANRA